MNYILNLKKFDRSRETWFASYLIYVTLTTDLPEKKKNKSLSKPLQKHLPIQLFPKENQYLHYNDNFWKAHTILRVTETLLGYKITSKQASTTLKVACAFKIIFTQISSLIRFLFFFCPADSKNSSNRTNLGSKNA